MQYLSKILRAVYQRLLRLSGGRLDVVAESVRRFVVMQGMEAAATLAYYALFSLFPLILFLAAALSYLLESSDKAYVSTVVFFGSALPVSFTLVQENLREILNLRGQIGVVGLIGALWSASSFFTTLARSVNRAWPGVRMRNAVHNRLVGLAMVGALFLLLLFSLLSSAFVNLVPSLLDTIGGGKIRLLSPLWRMALHFVPAIFSFLMFVALYRWVPYRLVCWRAVFQGAAMTVVAWESAKLLFGFYLSSGLTSYEFFYGSLGTVMALMFWIYLSCLIALFGAYLVATLDMRQQPETNQQPASVADRASAVADKAPAVVDEASAAAKNTEQVEDDPSQTGWVNTVQADAKNGARPSVEAQREHSDVNKG